MEQDGAALAQRIDEAATEAVHRQTGHEHDHRARQMDGAARDAMRGAPEDFGGIREPAVLELQLVCGVDVSEKVALAQVLEIGTAQRRRIDAFESQRLDRAAYGLAETDLVRERANLGRQSIAVTRNGLIDGLIEQCEQIEGIGNAHVVAHDVVRHQLVGEALRIAGLEADPAAPRERYRAQHFTPFGGITTHEDLAGCALALRELVEA
jgi:hypothetical protein